MSDKVVGQPSPSGEGSARKSRAIRCGWCLNDDHANCATAIQMGGVAGVPKTVWRCPCAEPGCATNRTRCVDCKRRDVEVTNQSVCVDLADCQEYRQKKRNADPQFQIIDSIRAASGSQTPSEDGGEGPKARKTPREPGTRVSSPKEGQCLCCGGATRGGKFLPGHDSRFVSTLAAEFVAFEDTLGINDSADAVRVRAEALGAALYTKFQKRVEGLLVKKEQAK